jgi:cell division protein FtsL
MSSFIELMQSVPPPFNMVVYIMLIICGSGVITSIFKQVRKYACHRQELEFKREMLDRGMSVDEVEQVVRARSKDTGSR